MNKLTRILALTVLVVFVASPAFAQAPGGAVGPATTNWDLGRRSGAGIVLLGEVRHRPHRRFRGRKHGSPA